VSQNSQIIAAKDEMLKELNRQIEYLTIQVRNSQKSLGKCEQERIDFSNNNFDSDSDLAKFAKL
jgi:hypothetical protein